MENHSFSAFIRRLVPRALFALCLGFASVGLVAIEGASAELKLATVDVNRILNESKDAQSRKKAIDGQAAATKKRLDERRSQLQLLEKKLSDAKVDQDSKEAEDFRRQARDFERMVKDSQEDLRKSFLKSNKELTDRTLELIKQFAQKQGYDVVFDKGEAGRGAVLFSEKIPDITDAVLKSLNG